LHFLIIQICEGIPKKDSDMKIQFNDRTALVTGATRGIGKRIADDLASLGARVIGTGTHEDEINRLKEKGEPGREWLQVDFSNPESTQAFLDQVPKVDIDILINNAGTNRIDYLEETRLEDWDFLMDVNLKAPYLLIRQIGRAMKIRGYGRIVNITSIWAHGRMEKRSIYITTKFGLRGLTKIAAYEWAADNVLVNAVAPGFTATELSKQTLGESGIREVAEKIPMKRFAQPLEISRVVLFLASELNTYIVGQSIVVDGGFVNV
jgi:NAD(P)-dependent dehydrogenase (short-subunit alcohol dehydrogenase family)